jgi:hypothetical protein
VSLAQIRIAPEEIVLRAEPFLLFKVAPAAAPALLRRISTLEPSFHLIVRESDATSFLLPLEDVERLGDLARERVAEAEPYRLLTFTATLPWTVVGFLARVTSLLAEHAIPLGAVAAYDRDHVFVRSEFAERAHAILTDAARRGRLP